MKELHLVIAFLEDIQQDSRIGGGGMKVMEVVFYYCAPALSHCCIRCVINKF